MHLFRCRQQNTEIFVTGEYGGGRIVRYSYYPTGRLKSVTDWNGKITNYGYDDVDCFIKCNGKTVEYDATAR